MAGPFEVDGRWFCDKGNVRVDDSDNNVLEAYGTDGVEDCLTRRGLRADKYVATYKFKWTTSNSPGLVVCWLSPGDYLVLGVRAPQRAPSRNVPSVRIRMATSISSARCLR